MTTAHVVIVKEERCFAKTPPSKSVSHGTFTEGDTESFRRIKVCRENFSIKKKTKLVIEDRYSYYVIIL